MATLLSCWKKRGVVTSQMAAPIVWGRGAGEGIGLSGHKNEYKNGVRIGNWVEEMAGAEAHLMGDSLKNFMKAQEDAHMAKVAPAERSVRVEPKAGVAASILFSHGRTFNEKFEASMSSLHFTDPALRQYGASSADRVHKSFFYGSKHIDFHVPKVDPNLRMTLTARKQSLWSSEAPPQLPMAEAAYLSQNSLSYVDPCVPPQRSSFARKTVKY